MSAARRILLLNQYVVPDVASTGRVAFEIASALAAAGNSVTFLAGQPSYTDAEIDAPAQELRDGVLVRRLGMGGVRGRTSLARRLAGYALYLMRAALAGLRLARRRELDVVVCFHNPPLLPLVAALVARRARARLIYVLLDIHPDILEATNWIALPRPVRWLWDSANSVMYRAASQVVVIGQGMKSVLVQEKGVPPDKVAVIPLWAEPELSEQPTDWETRSKLGVARDQLLLVFTGNMGVTQWLEPVAEAARELQGRPVRFVFVAGGIHAEQWRARLGELENVRFLSFLSGDDYERLLAASDAGLVTLAEGLERLGVPSRSFPYLAAGRPLFTVMRPEGDVARLIADERCGFNATSAGELVEAIDACLQDPSLLPAAAKRARAAYAAGFRREMLCRRYVELCTRAAPRQAPGPASSGQTTKGAPNGAPFA